MMIILGSHIWYYHGTSEKEARSIRDKKIKLNYYNYIHGYKSNDIEYHTYDFGPGFYLTESVDQAKLWSCRKSEIDLTMPIVIKFDLSMA